MSPLFTQSVAGIRPQNTLRILAIAIAMLFVLSTVADAKRRRKRKRKRSKKPTVTEVKEGKSTQKSESNEAIEPKTESTGKKGKGKQQVFDFTGVNLGASVRTPQLMYFLDRASEELQRASLQRRSFVPAMVLSISEEGL